MSAVIYTWKLFRKRLNVGGGESAWYEKIGVPRLHERLLLQVHRWAGRALTWSFPNGDQPLAALLRTRTLRWWRREAPVHGMLDAGNSGDWRHAKPGRVLAWEQVLCDTHGEDWWDAVWAKAEWKRCEKDFIEHVCERYGLQMSKPYKVKAAARPDRAELSMPSLLEEDWVWPTICKGFEIRLDCFTVAGWMNGECI